MMNDKKEWVLENNHLKLQVRAKEHALDFEFQDKKSGRMLAQGPYQYKLERKAEEGILVTDSFLLENAEMSSSEDGTQTLSMRGKGGGLEILHEFVLAPETPFLDEFLAIRNPSSSDVRLAELAFGFTLKGTDAVGVIPEELRKDRFVAVPYRRDTLGKIGEYQDYSIAELLARRGWYRTVSRDDAILPSDAFGAEGWIWTFGERALLIIKHSQEQMEFSLLELESQDDGTRLRFGGCGVWHGDPECLAELKPGAKIRFGLSRYQLLDGGFKEGYYAFRSFMDEHGHCLPDGYNPPVHWNELYDNPLWGGKDSPETRKKYYRKKDMEEEAAKAKELGCESLYLDPGWDTNFASTIWDDERLGTAESFMKLMKEKYNLSVSLHCPLAGWCDASTYPREADRMDANGKRIEMSLCSGARQYLDVKAERLKKLCEAGVVFLMYDGTGYTGPCFDENHGHPIPYTREAHCRAYLELAQKVHEKFPHVLIEMHDMIVAGVYLRYCPTYYLHGIEGSFDENWGFEYMWNPMADITSGRAISLYYYNLAYSLPLYLHIDLRKDNEHCLEFWWYASTCRHLGIGGKHPDVAIFQAHKAAMRRYLQLKEFYTQGVFYGFGEDVHVHALPNKQAAVVNIFNLQDEEVTKKVSFSLEKVGFKTDVPFTVEGAGCNVLGKIFECTRKMPPLSAAVIEIRPKE